MDQLEDNSSIGVLHSSKNLKIFASQKDAEEYNYKYSANQTPIERLQEVYVLIQKLYPLNERQPHTNKIYLDKYEHL